MSNIHPLMLLKLQNAWNTFTNNHPGVPSFLKNVSQNAVEAGTTIEIKVMTPSGQSMMQHIKLTDSDLALLDELKQLSAF